MGHHKKKVYLDREDDGREIIYETEINEKTDIIALENKIRDLLQCESASECKFIRSAPYKQVVISLLLKMNKVISFDEETKLYFGCNNMLSLFMHSDAKTIQITKKDINRVCSETISLMEEEEHEAPNEVENGMESIEAKNLDHHKRRKYPRKNQEETFVSKFIQNRHHSKAASSSILK